MKVFEIVTSTSGPRVVRIRDADRPGDLGAVAALHGVLYSREYGMDATMEASVAAGMAELVLARAREGDDGPGRMWVADDGERVLGAAGLTREEHGLMRLRWVILDPVARGHGVGRALLDVALAEGRRRDAAGVYLWTIAGLGASRHLYEQAGFTPTEERPARTWGIDVVEQRFDLKW
ncbi:MarR family transcriptional regulator [Embleya hyalina]|uniref:MarR family transcriptional regulator n=1 Tax=Embleya hyalina TaxID=516124 RepID=A0A401YTQ9_9ACTN|nr:MarR family transcriptional regulator [Embleya hyalina]